MYKNFFGLRENPFNINPDPRFLYVTPQTQEALDLLTYGVQSRKGCILLTGEVGTGKTTLINYLLEWLRERGMPTAFIFNSRLSAKHLFDFILTDFGIPCDFGQKENMLLQLNKWLLKRFRAGETPVLIVDEAQGLSFELLEEIRLLLNLETASEKLLQLVLVGQPELEERLKRPELRQFRQRIALRCNTLPLTFEETRGYIADRLRIGGATGNPIFSLGAMEAVHYYSRGIPRVINLLCEHALINAFVEHCNPVVAQMVNEAARDFLLDDYRPAAISTVGLHPAINNLTVLHSVPEHKLVSASRAEEEIGFESRQGAWPSAAPPFAVEEPGLTEEDSAATTNQEGGKLFASKESQTVSICVDQSAPIMSRAKPQPDGRESCREPIAHTPDSAAEVIAELKRILTTSSPIAPIHVVPPRVESQPPSALKGRQMADAKIRAFTLDTMNELFRHSPHKSAYPLLLSWKSWSRRGTTRFLAAAALLKWPAKTVAAFHWMRRPVHALQIWRSWVVGFKRDWNAMSNAVQFPEMRKFVVRWLRQPMSSKPMSPSKN